MPRYLIQILKDQGLSANEVIKKFGMCTHKDIAKKRLVDSGIYREEEVFKSKKKYVTKSNKVQSFVEFPLYRKPNICKLISCEDSCECIKIPELLANIAKGSEFVAQIESNSGLFYFISKNTSDSSEGEYLVIKEGSFLIMKNEDIINETIIGEVVTQIPIPKPDIIIKEKEVVTKQLSLSLNLRR